MTIDDVVQKNIATFEQEVQGIIAGAIEKAKSSGNTIMPNDLTPLFEQAFFRYRIMQTKIREEWLKVLKSDRGIANELGKLEDFRSLECEDVPRLEKLENEMNRKKEEAAAAKKRYEYALKRR